MPVEYRVRPLTRYIVTRFEDGVGSKQIGEYPSPEGAHDVAYALCDIERVRAGEPMGSPAFVYPRPVSVCVPPLSDEDRARIKAALEKGMSSNRLVHPAIQDQLDAR